MSSINKDSHKVAGKARFPLTDILDQNRSIGHAAGDRNQPRLLFMPTPPLQPHHPPSDRSISPFPTLRKRTTSIMRRRRTSSMHPQDPSKHGQPSTQNKVDGSEATPRHPSSFNQKDGVYHDMEEAQLRALCQNRGYAKGGKKADLIERLQRHDAREDHHAPTPDRPVGAGWLGRPLDRIKSVAKDGALLLVGVVAVIVLLWLFLTNYLLYPALITALEWFRTIIACIVAVAVALQVGKCFYYRPHSGYRSPTLTQDRNPPPHDPHRLPAHSQGHRISTSHPLQAGQGPSHPRLDADGDFFISNVGETDNTQLPSRRHGARSIEADLPLPSSSPTAIADQEEAVQEADKGQGLGVQPPQPPPDESRRTQEILKQKEIEEQRFQVMCQRFNDRPDIWVVVRFRDRIPSDEGKSILQYRHVRKDSYEELSIDLSPDTLLDESPRGKIQSVQGKTVVAPRIFDYILFPPASNLTVFETVEPMIGMLVNGRQVCIMADGPSGSGKSYTMLKGPTPVTALAVQAIFERLNTARRSGWEHSVECSILEICQEQPSDLLIPSLRDDRKQPARLASKGVRISRTEPYLTNCSRHALTSADRFMALLHQASKRRATKTTAMNQCSSRSDLVSIITISRSHTITGETKSSRCYLVDLVGSEPRSDRSIDSDEGKKIKEGRESLKRAMQAYQNRSDFVPRESQLTLLLSSCFKVPSKIVYLVTASPPLEDKQMTQAAITFASDVRMCGGNPSSRSSAK